MRLVKRITAAAMALTMTAALAGCGSSSGSKSTTAAADTTAAARESGGWLRRRGRQHVRER